MTTKLKRIDFSGSLNHEEVENWYDLLWLWIGCNDHSYDLWKFMKENLDETSEYPIPIPEHWNANLFMELLEKDEEIVDVKNYNKHFEKENKEYEDWKARGNKSEKDIALHDIITTYKSDYEQRTDTDATNIVRLLKVLATSNGIKYPDDKDEVEFLINKTLH